ncbi:uncharacterized protein [Diabrotica undecimpunctata]|uniref:uncharacterized protein isoform X2 n=1 Tax=Diabrotica undecimpunctata TaxID=50387 RepID=UPI003B63630B
MDYWFNTYKSQHDQSVNIYSQAQNSGSQYPSQQGADGKTRNRPTEMKVVGSMFSYSQSQSTTYVRDPFKNTSYSNSNKFPKKNPDDREFAEIFGKPKYPSGNKQPETMVGSFSRQESDIHREKSPLGYARASNSYGQIPSREMNTFDGERSQVHRETRGGSPPSTSERSRFGNETRKSPPNSERSRYGLGIRGRSPPSNGRQETRRKSPFTTRERRPISGERARFRRETRELSPLNRDRSPLDRNRSSDNRRDAKNMPRERGTGVDERIDFIPPGDNPYEPNRIERINPFTNNRNLDYTRDGIIDLCGDEMEDKSRSLGIKQSTVQSNIENKTKVVRDNPFKSIRNGKINRNPNYRNSDNTKDDIIELDLWTCGEEMEDKSVVPSNIEYKTIVVHRRYPDKLLKEFETRVLDAVLRSHIASITPNDRPQIEHGIFTGGEYVFTAKDQKSKAWLDDMVPKLKGHHEGIHLRVADIKELPPAAVKTMMPPVTIQSRSVSLWVHRKSCNEGPNVILSKLEAQNAGLFTSHWRFLRRKRSGKHFIMMTFKIDEEDVTRLQRINMRPELDGDQLKILIQTFLEN